MKAVWLEGAKKFAPRVQQDLAAKGITVTPVDDLGQCLAALRADRDSVVIVDLDLYRKGIEAVQEVHKHAPQAPVIVLASLEKLPVVDEAYKHGAWDSVIKQLDMSHLYELPRALARCSEKKRLHAEAQRLEAEAMRLQTELQRDRSTAEKAQADAKRYQEEVQKIRVEVERQRQTARSPTGHAPPRLDESGWLGMVLQACPEAVFAADPQSRLIFSNAALRDALGYGEEELVGKWINTFMSSLPVDEGSWTQIPFPYPQRRWQGRLEFKKRDGSSLPMTTRVVQALDSRGATRSTVVVCMTETAPGAKPASKNQATAGGKPAAGVSQDVLSDIIDDVQTPLAAMLGYLQIASTISPEQVEPNQLLAIERTAFVARRLLDLVVSHIGADEIASNRMEIHKSPLQIDHIIEPVLDAKRSEASLKNIEIAVDVPGDLPPVPIDGVQMERALGILLSHAIHVSPLGGSVTVAANLNGKELAVGFTDSGSGFTPQEIAVLFNRNMKLRRPGGDINTVGLYLAREIIRRHGGRLDVKSDPMQGTTFTLLLPLS